MVNSFGSSRIFVSRMKVLNGEHLLFDILPAPVPGIRPAAMTALVKPVLGTHCMVHRRRRRRCRRCCRIVRVHPVLATLIKPLISKEHQTNHFAGNNFAALIGYHVYEEHAVQAEEILRKMRDGFLVVGAHDAGEFQKA